MMNGPNFKNNHMSITNKLSNASLSEVDVGNSSFNESYQISANDNLKGKFDGGSRYRLDYEDDQGTRHSDYSDSSTPSPVKQEFYQRISYGNEGNYMYNLENAKNSQSTFYSGLNMNGAQNRSVSSFMEGPNDARKSTASLNSGGFHPSSNKGNYINASGSTSSLVPFRAGDWRCGVEGCDYHNFAKNVSCLKCGASRMSASVVMADGSHDRNQNKSSYSSNYQTTSKSSRHQSQGYNLGNQRYKNAPKASKFQSMDNYGNNRISSTGSMPWSMGPQASNHQYEDSRDGRATMIKKASSLHVQKHRNLQRQASLPSQQYQRIQRNVSNQNFGNNGQNRMSPNHLSIQTGEGRIEE